MKYIKLFLFIQLLINSFNAFGCSVFGSLGDQKVSAENKQITNAQIEVVARNILNNPLIRELQNIVLDYTNPDFENEYNRLKKIIESTYDRDLLKKTLIEIKSFREKLIKIDKIDHIFVDKLIKLNIYGLTKFKTIRMLELPITDYDMKELNIVSDLITEYTTDLDHGLPIENLLNELKSYLDENMYDICELEEFLRFHFFNLKLQYLIQYLYLKCSNSPLLHSCIRILHISNLIREYIQDWQRQIPFRIERIRGIGSIIFTSEKFGDNEERRNNLNQHIKEKMELFNINEAIEKFAKLFINLDPD